MNGCLERFEVSQKEDNSLRLVSRLATATNDPPLVKAGTIFGARVANMQHTGQTREIGRIRNAGPSSIAPVASLAKTLDARRTRGCVRTRRNVSVRGVF